MYKNISITTMTMALTSQKRGSKMTGEFELMSAKNREILTAPYCTFGNFSGSGAMGTWADAHRSKQLRVVPD
jgi:hypothetical protein